MKFAIAFLFSLICFLPTPASTETLCSIHVEWGYTPPSDPTVIGFNLYREGEFVCQVMDAYASAMDCTVSLIADTTNFTLTASFSDNTESPHSAPFAFNQANGRNPLQGFDEDFYLGEKLANLIADPELSAEWTGADKLTLLKVLQQYGLTAESHYNTYGYEEGLAPNAYFNAGEYTLAKATAMCNAGGYSTIQDALIAFKQAWPGDPYLHYLAYGDQEGINPSNNFDVSAYLEEKLAALQADPETANQYNSKADVRAALRNSGLTTLGHFLRFGIHEGLTARKVPQ
jgi:hypothetical protein